MTKTPRMIPRTLVAVVPMLALAACLAGTTAPSQFYVLTPIAPTGAERPAALAPTSNLVIGVGPVDIPVSLDRPEILTQLGPNEVGMAEFHRWAGSLKDEISRTLAENLSLLLGTTRVVLHPLQVPLEIDRQVAVEVLSFRAVPGGEVHLSTVWSVGPADGRKARSVRKAIYQAPLASPDPAAVVAALSRAIADLSRDIASEIRSRPAGA